MILQNRRKADISVAAAGETSLITAPGDGKYLAIDQLYLVNTSAQTIQLVTGSTNYGGAMAVGANGIVNIVNSYQGEDGVITCGNNEAFKINLGTGTQVSGFIRYRIVGE